jgi:DNA-3-methyladenine glycosylase
MRERRPSGRRRVLPRSFYDRPTLTVAGALVGKVLGHETADGMAAGMIVETEAYIGEDDPACHAAPGPTTRNAPLYGAPGFAYVYLNYGLHNLVNAVTESKGCPAAVLIRALEPKAGLDLMARRRELDGRSYEESGLCRGPGITLADNRLDLTAGALRIEDWNLDGGSRSWGPRIGIRVATERPWRCWMEGNLCVSSNRKRA